MENYYDLSCLGSEYLEFIKNNKECQFPIDYSTVKMSEHLKNYHVPLQSVPILINKEFANEFAHASKKVLDLVSYIPERIFGYDAEKLKSFYGYKRDDIVQAIAASKGFYKPAIARNDFILTRTGLKALELNCSTTLGGWNLPFFFSMYRNELPVSRFFEQHADEYEFSVRNTIRCFARFIADEVTKYAHQLGIDGHFNMALVGNEQLTDVAKQREKLVFSVFEEEVAKKGLTGKIVPVINELNQFNLEGDVLYAGEHRVHVAITTNSKSVCSELLHAFSNNNLIWPDNPLCFAYNNKLNFALLHEYKNSAHFSDAEREAIDKYIPLCWDLKNTNIDVDGQSVPMIEYLRSEKDNLVIKDATGKQGDDVFIGRTMTDEQWLAAIDSGLQQRSWLVQKFCESVPFMAQSGDCGLKDYDIILGTFTLGDGYGGTQSRMKEKGGSDGVINAAKGAKEGMIIEVSKR